jgi:prepilin-type N-terminal cleavage/methylation domain-containing protein
MRLIHQLNQPIGGRASRRAFTLVELMLVMALLIIVMAFSAPTLKNFFHGRTLDSEARRFLSLTRYGQSRAVSEGVPIVLWIDAEERTYGLQIEPSYTEDEDTKSVEYEMDKDLKIIVGDPKAPDTRVKTIPMSASAMARTRSKIPMIRFQPDGFINETSPENVVIAEGEINGIQIAQSRNRLNYEIQTNFQYIAQP